MSRIGRKPIVIPAGVTVTVDEAAHTVAVKGPKGSLNSNYHPLMTVKVEGNEVLVTRPNDEPEARGLHGLTRTNIANMVNGVVNGYEKKLEIVGVGLRCQKQGSNLVMNLGFSHQVMIVGIQAALGALDGDGMCCLINSDRDTGRNDDGFSSNSRHCLLPLSYHT